VTTLAPGEELFLFTDGVNEAMSPVNEQWGDERLTERLLQIADQPMAEQTEAIVASVREHANGAEQSDDITVMALCRRKVD
ncbi:MAG: SpoIIE family protein phosphatase, partial [Xanthomonadales bacterium]|nr:SpoIIE family protein phosphatase [Xanthomonadales bacterium]